MKEKIILTISLLSIFVFFSNYTGLKTIIGGLPVYNYTTQNNDYNIVEVPWKGIKFENVKVSYENFKKENSTTKDTILYRTFKKNPLKFWYWDDYLTHERYKLPYKSIN